MSKINGFPIADRAECLKFLRAEGVAMWMETTAEDRRLGKGMWEAAVRRLNERGNMPADADHETQMNALWHSVFACDWAENAFPQLVTGHKYGAALCCTSLTKELAEDIVLPWKAFVVVVPDGLIPYESNGILGHFAAIHVHAWEIEDAGRLQPRFRIALMCEDGLTHVHGKAGSLADILFDDDVFSACDNAWARGQRMCRRLVVGLLYAMQHTNNFRDTGPRTFRDATRVPREDPKHRNVFIGKPMSTDARAVVAHHVLEGTKHAPPAVQVLVRGHYKRQVIGIGRGGRKVIWVEPYWRGPEDAPILARPYRVGPKDPEAE